MKKGLLKIYIFPMLLALVVAILAMVNYKPGTYLSGWDTLHPEFNFSLSWDRALSVWQNFQGLGSAPSQAQATELVRIPILWLFSLVVPISAIRYVFMFFTWLVGVLGMYKFMLFILGKNDFKSKGASFIASLFYLLNLATVQQYFVPLSMFAVHFAGLPWLFLWASKYLKNGKKKNLLIYSLLSLLFSPMAHTPTLFYVYLTSFMLFGAGFLLKKGKVGAKRLVVLLGATILMNAYWLLPNIYYLINHGTEVSSSAIHQNFSGEARLQSQLYGTSDNLVKLKNFLFNWHGYDFEAGEYTPLMGDWVEHINNPSVQKISILFFGLSLLGLLAFILSGSVYGIGLGLVFLMGVFFWHNSNPPFGNIFVWLQNKLELFKEGFRFPFTKFSLVMVFSQALFVGKAVRTILSKLKGKVVNLIFVGLVGLIIILSKPAFSGWFISPLMRVEIPNEYFETFEWFDNQPNERVLKLPMQSMYGWNFYDWGYQGAGFTWFGIKQPTLDREFDRWNALNENAYKELVSAYFEGDFSEFEALLSKYKVGYVLYDDSIVLPGHEEKVLLEDRFNEWLKTSEKLNKEYENGDLKVFGFEGEAEAKAINEDIYPFSDLGIGNGSISYSDGYLEISSQLNGVKGKVMTLGKYENRNVEVSAERLYDGSYLVNFSLSYPGIYLDDREVAKEEKQKIVKQVKDVDYVVVNGKAFDLNLADYFGEKVLGYVKIDGEFEFGVGNEVDYEDDKKHVVLTDKKVLSFEQLERDYKNVRLLKDKYELKIVYGVENNDQFLDNFSANENNCSFSGEGEIEAREYFRGFGLSAKNGGVNCTGLVMEPGMDYLVAASGENVSGRSLKAYVTDIETGFSLYEWVFDEGVFNEGFLVTKKDKDMWLGFEARSFGRIESENVLGNLIILPVDFLWMEKIKVWSVESAEEVGELMGNNSAFEKGFSGYLVKNEEQKKLPFLFGKKLEHMKANDWENGWIVPKGSEGDLVVFYWPQYLEWGGLLLLVIVPIYLIIKKKSRSFN